MAETTYGNVREGERVRVELKDGTSLNAEFWHEGPNGVAIEPLPDRNGHTYPSGFLPHSQIKALVSNTEISRALQDQPHPMSSRFSQFSEGELVQIITVDNRRLDAEFWGAGSQSFLLERLEGGRWEHEHESIGLLSYDQVLSVRSFREISEDLCKNPHPLFEQVSQFKEGEPARIVLSNEQVIEVEIWGAGPQSFMLEPLLNGRWDLSENIGLLSYDRVKSIQKL